MKRSPELTPLSHDHHQALFVAMQMKRAGVEDSGDAFQKYLDFHEKVGAAHFRVEEEVLLPAWIAAVGSRADRKLIARTLTEHAEIRAAARSLATGVQEPAAVRRFGEMLEDHVRFEERELFPLIEDALDPGDLALLGSEMARSAKHQI